MSYVPIDCDFHDELESAATLRRKVTLVVHDAAGERRLEDVIADLGHERPGEPRGEYMTLGSGERIRFDRIVSIDGKVRPA